MGTSYFPVEDKSQPLPTLAYHMEEVDLSEFGNAHTLRKEPRMSFEGEEEPDCEEKEELKEILCTLAFTCSDEWREESERSSENLVFFKDKAPLIRCKISGYILPKIYYDMTTKINVISRNVAAIISPYSPLTESNKLFRQDHLIFPCEEIMREVLVEISGQLLSMNFHVFDIPNPVLVIIGTPILKLANSQEVLSGYLGKSTYEADLKRVANSFNDFIIEPNIIEEIFSASMREVAAPNPLDEMSKHFIDEV